MALHQYPVASDEKGVRDKTITSSDTDIVTFANDCDSVEIAKDDSVKLYVTVDGTTPTVSGQKTITLPAQPCARRISIPTSGPTVVKVVCATGTVVYDLTDMTGQPW